MPKARNPNHLLSVGPKAARNRFTNRVEETRRFLDLLNGAAGAPLPLLMFYGVGGAGKTRLLDHLQQRCEARGIPWAAVDLAEFGEADRALPALAAQLETKHALRFDSFKQALAVLAARSSGGTLSPRLAEYVAGSGQAAADLVLDSLGLLPVVGQLAAVVKLAKGASQTAFKQAMQRKPFRDAMLRLGGEGELLELVEWRLDQLSAELQRRFAADLVNSLPPQPGQAGRGVLFFDTHEALWRDTHGGAGTQDGWIRLLREYVHDAGVLVVMAGRDRLRWPDDWDETDAYGRKLWLEQHLLGGLSTRDAREFLHRADVQEYPAEPFAMPEALQAAILRATNERADPDAPGQHHCYLLAICAEIVANTRAATGAYPSPALFERIPRGDAAVEPLARRFLTSLRNEPMVNWIEELSLTPRFDEEFALALDQARRHNNARAGWERLRELSLLEEWEDGFLEMHPLLRDSLRSRLAPERSRAVHAWAAQYWSEHAAEDDLQRRGLAWYHRRFVDHAAALDQFKALHDAAERRADATTVRDLVDWWRYTGPSDALAPADAARERVLYGQCLRRLTTGNRAANLLRAIAGFEAALTIYTERDFPAEWAEAQNSLGNAYWDLPTGERSANLRRAMACYEAALRVYTEAKYPFERARTQNNLGNAYLLLPTGDRTANVQLAIACYAAALRVRTEADTPYDWARTQNSLGNAYWSLPSGDRAANLARAITCFEAALRVYTRAEYPYDWARTQNNLGNAYWALPAGDRAVNLQRAIACYEAQLQVFTETDFPLEWARAQSNLGEALSMLNAGDGGNALQRAIGCYESALRVLTEDDFPTEWAWTKTLLGRAYRDLPEGDGTEHLSRAVGFFDEALRVRTEAARPGDWAETQYELGLALQRRGDTDRARDAFAAAARGYRAIGDAAKAVEADAARDALPRITPAPAPDAGGGSVATSFTP
jgi:tetratricopeptide (TPR) repeat protein